MTAAEKIREIVTREPGKYTQSDLSRLVGISRQRVHQIINEEGLRDYVKMRAIRTCKRCGKRIPSRRTYCDNCIQEMRAETWTTVICDWCGKEFRKRKSDVQYLKEVKGQEHFFCSKECRINWWNAFLRRWWDERKVAGRSDAAQAN